MPTIPKLLPGSFESNVIRGTGKAKRLEAHKRSGFWPQPWLAQTAADLCFGNAAKATLPGIIDMLRAVILVNLFREP